MVTRTNAFTEACNVEAAGVEDIVKFLDTQSHHGRFVMTDKGRLSEDLQRSVGDAMLNCRERKVWGIEFKVEDKDKHGNFYLETWSNLTRKTAGWMFTLNADILLYYFREDGRLYSVPFQKLCRWAFGCGERDKSVNPGRIYSFPERKQSKYEQLNDTWGRCVPISVVQTEVGFVEYTFSCGEWKAS